MTKGATRVVVLATSNRGKLEEARRVLGPLGLRVRAHDVKGTEIQAETTSEVATASSKEAALRSGVAVLVEDAGLFVDALGGFPGVYSSYAFKTLGLDGIITLLAGRARRARFVSSVAYCKPGGEPKVFEGSVRGRISNEARGSSGFGFDPIFVPEGEELTFGELTLDEKCAISHRAVALRRFARWYLARLPG